jgi:hypothetical protein
MADKDTSSLATLHLMLWPGLLLAAAGALLGAADLDEGPVTALRLACIGIGAVLVAISTVGFGIMLGLEAADERRGD